MNDASRDATEWFKHSGAPVALSRLLAGCIAASGLAVLVAGEPLAQTPPNGPEESTGINAPTDLEFARLLLVAGRFQDAVTFLEQASPVNETERLERHLLLGKTYMLLDRRAAAIEHYEEALALRPDLTEVRVELARAHFMAGQDFRARHHFELALDAGLPSSVEATVRRSLNAIDARKRWSGYVSTALLPETNAVRRTDRQTIEIGGIPFRLNDDARSASGVGLQIAAGGTFSPRLTNRTKGHFAISSAAKIYENAALNDIAVSGRAGLTQLTNTGSVSGGIQAGRRWIGSDGFHVSSGLWGRVNHRVSERLHSSVRVELDFRKHDDHRERDGWRATVNPTFRFALDGRTRLEASPGVEWVNAKAKHHASRTTSASIGIVRVLGNHLTASITASVLWRSHRDRDPLFDRTRKDRTVQLGSRVFHGSWRLRGFAPYVDYSFERNTANIEVHEYRNHGAIIGLSREF